MAREPRLTGEGAAWPAPAAFAGPAAPGPDGMDFFRAGLERNVIVVPGKFFDVDPGRRRDHIPSRLRNYVRVSYGPSMKTLQMGLDRLDGLIREA